MKNSKKKSLAEYPRLVKEWHPTNNVGSFPSDFSYGSGKRVWWKCEQMHEWEATIVKRTSGRGCPYCSGHKLSLERTLAFRYPKLVNEWHPSKNGKLTPDEVSFGNDKKVWWECDKGHEWQAAVGSRTRGRGCPKCNEGTQTSFPELCIYYYIHSLYPDAERQYTIPHSRMSIDIFIPSLNLAIEYDGSYFHQDLTRDMKKDELLSKHMPENKLIRVREQDCPIYTPLEETTELYCLDDNNTLSDIITRILNSLVKEGQILPRVDIASDEEHIYELIEEMDRAGSIALTHPQFVEEWHPSKNGKLRPENITFGSNRKVWWRCSKGHDWRASANRRQIGDGCPYCSGRRFTPEHSLNALYPHVAIEWHPYRNGALKPEQISARNGKRVWWQCERGHEWDAVISNRTSGRGCPYCAGQRLTPDKSLSFLYPSIAKEWHPEKNGLMQAGEISAKSNQKVWWKCEKNHEWEANVYSRAYGVGCPYCSGIKLVPERALSVVHPEITREWHPSKNGSLRPDAVSFGSNKMVWWQCQHGFSWKAPVIRRTRTGKIGHASCPSCKTERKQQKAS